MSGGAETSSLALALSAQGEVEIGVANIVQVVQSCVTCSEALVVDAFVELLVFAAGDREVARVIFDTASAHATGAAALVGTVGIQAIRPIVDLTGGILRSCTLVDVLANIAVSSVSFITLAVIRTDGIYALRILLACCDSEITLVNVLTRIRIARVSSAANTLESTVVVDAISCIDAIVKTIGTFVDVKAHVWIVDWQAGVCSESVGTETSVRTDSIGAFREGDGGTVVDSATFVDVGADVEVGVEVEADSAIAVVRADSIDTAFG